jgi:hypothetical protein
VASWPSCRNVSSTIWPSASTLRKTLEHLIPAYSSRVAAEGAEEAVGAAEAAEAAEVAEVAEVAEAAEAGVFPLEVSASAVPNLCWRGPAHHGNAPPRRDDRRAGTSQTDARRHRNEQYVYLHAELARISSRNHPPNPGRILVPQSTRLMHPQGKVLLETERRRAQAAEAGKLAAQSPNHVSRRTAAPGRARANRRDKVAR